MITALILQTCAVAIALVLLVAAVGKHHNTKVMYFIYLAMAILVYALAGLFGLFAQTADGAYMAVRFRYIASSVLGPLLFLFVHQYCNRPVITRWRLILWVVPAICIAAVVTWPHSRAFFGQGVFWAEPLPRLRLAHGPLFYAAGAYSGLLFGLSIYTVGTYFSKNTQVKKRQAAIFVVALVLAAAMYVVRLQADNAYPPYLTSLVLSLVGLLSGYYILRHRKEEWLPFSQAHLLRILKDGYVLLDSRDCFLEANATAQQYFPGLRELVPGDSVAGVRHFPMAMLKAQVQSEDFLLSKTPPQYLRMSVSVVEIDSATMCRCVMFYDVSEMYRLMEELQTAASRDHLTGLLNRGAFFDTAEQNFRLAQRYGQQAAVLMIDVDHFKRVNDNYGHACGDMALKELGGIMQKWLRSSDICGRYGGEEICVFLPETGAAAALVVAEKLRKVVENTPMNWGKGVIFNLTISIGVSQFDKACHKNLEALVADADTALYCCKNYGRNCVMLHGVVPAGKPAVESLSGAHA